MTAGEGNGTTVVLCFVWFVGTYCLAHYLVGILLRKRRRKRRVSLADVIKDSYRGI